MIRVGFVGYSLTMDCRSSKKFRLASYSEERFCATLESNLACLGEIMRYSVEHGMLHFRISSELVPFASHPVCSVDWAARYTGAFAELGAYARAQGMRLSMHPGQYTLINSTSEATVDASIRELVYHAQIFDLMGMDATHKIQIHVGGIYGDKDPSIARFVENFGRLPEAVRRRLVVENDDRLYNIADCLRIHEAVGTPIVFDNLHHRLLNAGESMAEAFEAARATWTDARMMVDYSSQGDEKRIGGHADTLDEADFRAFLADVPSRDFDCMIEIKDKDLSALKALRIVELLP
jgi:UV DNA damage endonuclease